MSRGKKETKKADPSSEAYRQAEKDILKDPELSDSDAADDLDEGELARKDNSSDGDDHSSDGGHHSVKGKGK